MFAKVGCRRHGGGRLQQAPMMVLFNEVKNNPSESIGSQAHEGGVKAEELASRYSHRPPPNMQSMRVLADKFDFSPIQLWFGDPGRAISGTAGWCKYMAGGCEQEWCVCVC